ncbi:MAG: hypothetical protein IJG50_03595 [Clostridia bacterium]|nr:hypothetical protein [Clostridia bacterium]
MENRVRPTRAGLFAIELLIAVGIFAFCVAVCGGLFVRAEVVSRDSVILNKAVNEARVAAECFKASGGDIDKTARLTGGDVENDALVIELDDGLVLHLNAKQEDGFVSGKLDVTFDGEELIDWNVAALEEET